jgi:hypothetical protein
VYDLAADQRRKIANQRNIQELVQKGEDIERLCVVLGGILATIRAGNPETLDDLTQAIRNMTGLPDLSFYVNGLMATWPEIYLEFQTIDFYLDDAPRRPSVEMIEHTHHLSSSAAAAAAESISEGDIKNEEELDHTGEHSQVRFGESGAKRFVIEPHSSTANMNTREHTLEPVGDVNVDGPMAPNQPRGSDSNYEGLSPRSSRSPRSPGSNRAARPWELR